MARPAISTNGSKIGASINGGSTWKWSLTQIDSKPSASASRAESTVRSQAVARVETEVLAITTLRQAYPELHVVTPPDPNPVGLVDPLPDPADERFVDGHGVDDREPQSGRSDVGGQGPDRLGDVVPGHAHRLGPDVDARSQERLEHPLRLVLLERRPDDDARGRPAGRG